MRRDFKRDEKIKRLLWCDRHCCLCGNACGLDIELAHIGNPEDNDIDNAIPVCYDCHAEMGMYNERHPRGTKLRPEEIKARREQIYERHTRHYVAPIQSTISQDMSGSLNQRSGQQRQYPAVSFTLANLSDFLSTQLTIRLRGLLNKRSVDLQLAEPLYRGEKV